MPSDPRITLSSVLSSTALRLSALVAAAMSAGYLWRAAVEPGGSAAKLSAAQPVLSVKPSEVTFNSLDLIRPSETEEAPAAGGQADTVAQKQGKPKGRSSAQLVSVTVSGSQPGSGAPAPGRRSTHPGRTKPAKPGRKPTPRPAPAPRPNPPPPPAPQPPPPPPPAPSPVAPPPPPPPPVTAPGTRPGRGRGDKNHHHTGPPGQQKPKKGKQGGGGSQGQSSPPEQGSTGGNGKGTGNGKGKGKG